MIHHRYLSIAALATIFGGTEGASIRSVMGNQEQNMDEQKGDEPDWVKANMGVEKGFKCKAGANKRKMYATRECEGGFKQTADVQLKAKDLVEDVVVNGVLDMRSSMMATDNQMNVIGPSKMDMEELSLWDDYTDNYDKMFEGEDCSEDDGGCKKMIEFGGYAKVFWGCNVTFSFQGKKVSKEVECGGKTFEGAGAKPKFEGYDMDGLAEEAHKKKIGLLMENKIHSATPRSAYSIFYQKEKAKMIAKGEILLGDDSMEDDAVIMQRWKDLKLEKRDAYEKLAEADKMRASAESVLYDLENDS